MKRLLVGLALLPLVACAPGTPSAANYFPFRDGETIEFDVTYLKERVTAQLSMSTSNLSPYGNTIWAVTLDQKKSEEPAGLLVDTRNNYLAGFVTLNSLTVTKIAQTKFAYCFIRPYTPGTRVEKLRGTAIIGTTSELLENTEGAFNPKNPCTMSVNSAAAAIHAPLSHDNRVDAAAVARAIAAQLGVK
jgi:hypothetical protein